ncbi:MAG: ATP-binding protein [bacterium]|nr:ATP-binding protein [bacterium]
MAGVELDDRERFEAAQRLLERRRAERGIVSGKAPPPRALKVPWSLDPERAAEVIAAAKAAPAGWAPCEFCQQDAPAGGCDRLRCCERRRARRWAAGSKELVLNKSRTPDAYRDNFDIARLPHLAGDFPRAFDYVASNGLGHPAYLDARADEWAGKSQGQNQVSLIGMNGRGKSRLAAEMMFRAIRARSGEIESACWVTAAEIGSEERETPLGQPRPLRHRCRTSGIVVVDDMGWSGRDAEAMANLCEWRHSRRRPTIWTTHLPWASGPGLNLRKFAPMIYRRLSEGLIFQL